MAWVNLAGESYTDVSQLKKNIAFKEYYDSLREYNIEPLPDEEIRRYVEIYQTSDDEEKRNKALQIIMLHNQGLVMSLIMKYGNVDNCADLIGEVNLSLQKAVEMFDLDNRSSKFYTYALTTMFRTITKVGDKFSNPMYHLRSGHDRRVINDFIDKFYQENMREPTEDEIKEFVVESKEVRSAYDNVRNLTFSSFDANNNDSEDDGDYNKLITDTSKAAYNEDSGSVEFNETLNHNMHIIMNILNNWIKSTKSESMRKTKKRNFEIMCKFYGLNGYSQRASEDLCEEYGVVYTTIFNAIRECICVVRREARNNKQLAEALGLTKEAINYSEFNFVKRS